eukprot:COSAG01_NODE_4176_length_5267_cov_34.739164_1_plen_82_part_00
MRGEGGGGGALTFTPRHRVGGLSMKKISPCDFGIPICPPLAMHTEMAFSQKSAAAAGPWFFFAWCCLPAGLPSLSLSASSV